MPIKKRKVPRRGRRRYQSGGPTVQRPPLGPGARTSAPRNLRRKRRPIRPLPPDYYWEDPGIRNSGIDGCNPACKSTEYCQCYYGGCTCKPLTQPNSSTYRRGGKVRRQRGGGINLKTLRGRR